MRTAIAIGERLIGVHAASPANAAPLTFDVGTSVGFSDGGAAVDSIGDISVGEATGGVTLRTTRAVPEPSIWAMLQLGFARLSYASARRAKQVAVAPFVGAACAGVALFAVFGVVEPAKADTIVEDFTVNGTAVFDDGFFGITSSSFAEFNPAVETLSSVTLSFSGIADFSVDGSTMFPQATFNFISLSSIPGVLAFGHGGRIEGGSFPISADQTFSDAEELSLFEGSGADSFGLYFAVDGGVVSLSGQSGTLTYEYTPTASPVPEPSTWAMLMIGFAGLGYAGYRRARRPCAAV